jgi:hypothetical protein
MIASALARPIGDAQVFFTCHAARADNQRRNGIDTMSRYRPGSLRGRTRLLLAALSAALLAVSCTHATPHPARSMHGGRQAVYLWPRGAPITYNDIACGGEPGCSSGFTGSVPLVLRRPLHLPALVHGHCPTQRARLVEPHLGPAEGQGPVYPHIDDNGGPSGVLTFADPPLPGSVLAGTGFGGQKVLWITAPRYRWPVLIRAAK